MGKRCRINYAKTNSEENLSGAHQNKEFHTDAFA
jgi:hypothetical protein